MNSEEKYCGSCKNFIGGGDFGLCCTKKPYLCYALDKIGGCEFYEYDPASDWLHECPFCGEITTYYHRVGDASKLMIDGEEYTQEKFWYCPVCKETIKMLLENSNGEKFIWEAEK